MKKRLCAALFAALLLFCVPALAQAEVFCGLEIDLAAEKIDFGDTPVTDVPGLMALLDRMPNLRQVDMYASALKREEMDQLFDGYPQIFFGWTLVIERNHIVRTDATSFSTLHGRCPNHETEAFEVLRYCRNLVALDVGHNNIRDISFLRNFPKMKVLILACNLIEDISVLAELKELEYLELFSNKIRDLSPLAQLPMLKDLNISNNPCTDLTPLYSMDYLERFWSGMNEKRITYQERRDMEAALPDCAFFWDGEPTQGGWRKHHRYDTIYAIFNEGGYRPFQE